MGGSVQQGAFEWGGHEPPARVERVEAAERPGTPPTKVGGGARSAVGKTAHEKDRAALPAPQAPAALPPDNELWDVHAAARFLKRSVSWVYHKAEDGTLPVRRLGGWGVRFVPADLRAWVESAGGHPHGLQGR